MKGLTPSELVTITDFIQKHHKFGYVHEENQIKGNLGYSIKYIDACYDSRQADYWAISFRGFGKIIFTTNAFGLFNEKPKGFTYTTLYDWIMAFLNYEWEPEGKAFDFMNGENNKPLHNSFPKMEKEITNEMRARIFAAYWGAEITIGDNGNVYPLVQLNGNAVCVGKNKLKVDMWWKIGHCRLILKPLSDISDEDAIYLFNIVFPNMKHDKQSKINWGKYTVALSDKKHPVDYLRSKGYDLGYGSIPSLIAANVAINKSQSK